MMLMKAMEARKRAEVLKDCNDISEKLIILVISHIGTVLVAAGYVMAQRSTAV